MLSSTNQTRRAELVAISENLNAWKTMVRKEKAIYHTMNLANYDAGRKCLITEGWCPSFDIPSIQFALKEATVSFKQRNNYIRPLLLNSPFFFATTIIIVL